MSYDIKFDFVWEDGVLTIEPLVLEADPNDVGCLEMELEDEYGTEAVVTGTLDEDGDWKVEHVEKDDD